MEVVNCVLRGKGKPKKNKKTERLCEVGKLIGIKCLDHVVIGGQGRYFSFADQGILG